MGRGVCARPGRPGSGEKRVTLRSVRRHPHCRWRALSPQPQCSAPTLRAGGPDLDLRRATASWGQTLQCSPGESLTQPIARAPLGSPAAEAARAGRERKAGVGTSSPGPTLGDFLPGQALPVFPPRPLQAISSKGSRQDIPFSFQKPELSDLQTSRSGPLGRPRK